MQPGRLYQGRPCAHRGTVWRIKVVGAHAWEPELGQWECTRCGARWCEDPRPLLGPPGSPGRARSLAELGGDR